MYDEDGPRAMAQARLPPVLAMEAQTPGPLRIPGDLQALIRRMASENPIWGEQRIADELRIKLVLRVSPRKLGKYLARGSGPRHTPDPKQRWKAFIRNQAKDIAACDFFVVTARFRSFTSLS
ncbi:MAG: hypothetical protein JWP08_1416 [Bryobacterales bacterium]|nr:hypothetical protein [Bryobacterales bacterium]